MGKPANHATLGPIVRINPNEVHINDPACVDTIYNFNPNVWKKHYYVGTSNQQVVSTSSGMPRSSHVSHIQRWCLINVTQG